MTQQVLEAFKVEIKVNHGEILEKCVILSAAEQQCGKKFVFNQDNDFRSLKSGLCASI